MKKRGPYIQKYRKFIYNKSENKIAELERNIAKTFTYNKESFL